MSAGGFNPNEPTFDPWTEGLIANGDMIKANVASGLDRGDVLFVEMNDNGKLRTTWKEIIRSMIAGKVVVVRHMRFADTTVKVNFDVLQEAGVNSGGYYIRSVYDNWYNADGVDDAPVSN